jgi:hypothetical protein
MSSTSGLATTTISALTTTFTPSQSCLAEYFYYQTTYTPPATAAVTTLGTHFYVSLGPAQTSSATTCLPAGWAPASQYFSPGICPSGYSMASSTFNTTGAVTETQALCCPSNYIASPTNDTDWGSQLWLTDRCTLLVADQTEVITVTTMFGTDSLQAAASGPGLGINAYGVSIRWQSTDRISSSSTNTTSFSSGTSTPTPKPTISTGAKAGIAVGVVVFALIIILCIAFFAISRRRAASASNKENTTELQNAWLGLNKPELAATESKAMLPKELPDNQILEAESGAEQRPLHELE